MSDIEVFKDDLKIIAIALTPSAQNGKIWSVKELHVAYRAEIQDKRISEEKFKQRFYKHKEGIFASTGTGGWVPVVQETLDEVIDLPSEFKMQEVDMLKDLVREAIEKRVATITDDQINEVICKAITKLMPKLVKQEFENRVIPAVNQAIEDKVASLHGIEAEVKGEIISTLIDLIKNLSEEEVAIVPRDELDLLGYDDE
jgi:hypothetical protein